MRLCEFCEKINKKKNLVYEDEECFAMLGAKPSSPGHMIVMPKHHYTILEQVPDKLIAHLFCIANDLTKLILKKLGAKGANLLVRNGIPAGQSVPHFSIHIIPRYVDDGIKLKWDPKNIPEDKMNKYQNAIRTHCKTEDHIAPRLKKEIKVNYMHKQLFRRP